jgi:hypothetical protein
MDNIAFALVPATVFGFLVFKPRGMKWGDYLFMKTPEPASKPPRPNNFDVTLGWLRKATDMRDLPDDTPILVRNSRTGCLMQATYALVESKPDGIVLETF